MEQKRNLSLFQVLAYSSGSISCFLINQIIVDWGQIFYSPPPSHGCGVSHTTSTTVLAPVLLIGYAMFFGRIVDAVADPLVGYWSDRIRTRWGRRIPFVALGSPFMVLFFVLLWRPPINGIHPLNALYVGLVMGGFFVFYTIVVAPYLSLMPEISRTRSERIQMSTWEAVFGVVGLAIAAIGAPLIIGDDLSFMKMAVIMSVITLFFLYFSIAFIREPVKDLNQQETFKFLEAVSVTLKNKAFVSWVICIFMFWIGFNVIQTSTAYYVTCVLSETYKDVALYKTVMMVMAVPMFIVVFQLSKRMSNKKLVMIGMIFFTVLTPLFMFAPYIPLEGNLPLISNTLFPLRRIFSMFIFGLLSIPIAVLMIMANAIIADVVDLDETITGRRREAMFFGMQGLVTKSAIGISYLVGTQLLSRFGMTSTQPMGILLAGPFCAIFTFIGFLSISKYPLKN